MIKDIKELDAYQELCAESFSYPRIDNDIVYLTLGLVGEAGEIADKIKKVMRDNDGVFSEKIKIELAKEGGDVLWYLSNLFMKLNISLSTIAKMNLKKLDDRRQRGKINGEGDNR